MVIPTIVATEAQIYLASRSPRRAELLRQIGVRFAVVDGDCDERQLPAESPPEYVQRLALTKAQVGCAQLAALALPPLPVLAADTAVICEAQILGKPRDREEALAMLRLLSGRTHQVLTAVALALPTESRHWLRLSTSRVTFRPLTEAELEAYWQTGEPRDKAGAYGIQGRAALFITHLDGSYSGVMGLPLCDTGDLLAEIGIQWLIL
ncbi:septum formation protein Maf [Chromatium okenii]|uniref:Maf family protein n=1 Tax=Chromatium okenii TaxID=61644 RepID=UPI0019070892|nr:Maf family protein [Chromatium okenii]MBK1642549.1 septum formation protein Maf [Chromatium okenii]